jgi:hypothetical protein
VSKELRFLLDESGFEDVTSCLENALELLLLRITQYRRHGVGKFSLVWETIVGGHTLAEWLFNREFAIDRDLARAIQIALDRSPNWDELENVQGFPTEVQLGQAMRTAYSVAAAATLVQRGCATGAISPALMRIGTEQVGLTTSGGNIEYAAVHFVGDDGSQLAFFRDLAEVEDLAEDAYFENARHAFPRIVFHRERVRFSAFDEEYRTIRPKVSHHLSILNDRAKEIFSRVRDPRNIASEFGSHGVEASGESGNTKGNADAMSQRRVVVGGQSVMLEWHTKIRSHIDRIYFNATGERIVVGVFHKHLD